MDQPQPPVAVALPPMLFQMPAPHKAEPHGLTTYVDPGRGTNDCQHTYVSTHKVFIGFLCYLASGLVATKHWWIIAATEYYDDNYEL